MPPPRGSPPGPTAPTAQESTARAVQGRQAHHVEFRRADLAGDLEAALGPSANLVTASALFDLASPEFIARLAAAVAARKSAFYTVLTYDGDQRWTPEHEADAALLEAFHAHQRRDKGFGPAAGPDAPDALSEAFAARGYAVQEGDSAWRLGAEDEALIAELAVGLRRCRAARPAKSMRRRSPPGAPSPAPAPSSATPTRWPCRRLHLQLGMTRKDRSMMSSGAD